MTHGSLFSGIGGFELAARWCGFTNVFSCEIEPFNRRVLHHHFPESEMHDDIKEMDATQYNGRVDIISGGFPCQPYSVAGKRLGKEDERHLWPEMLRIIREVAPTYVVGENVFGLVNWSTGMVFEEVCIDLETEGYDVQPFILPAAGVGAPHRRDRVWFVAHSNNKERDGRSGASERERQAAKQGRDGIQRTAARFSEVGVATNTNDRRAGREVPARRDEFTGGTESNATNTQRARLDFGTKPGSLGESQAQARERATNATETIGEEWRASKSKKWDDFPTQPPVCGGDDGLPAELDGITFPKWRANSIKAYGNAIVPQVAYQIFDTIKQMNQ